MLHNGLQVDYSVHKLQIILKNIFLLHINMLTHDTCHWYAQKYLPLAYKSARLSSNISQCATSHVLVQILFHLKKLFMLMNGIILIISKHDTLKPLGIQFRPFANSVRDTKYHKRCSPPNLMEVHAHAHVVVYGACPLRLEIAKAKVLKCFQQDKFLINPLAETHARQLELRGFDYLKYMADILWSQCTV